MARKTTAHVKDGRLTVLTGNARTPGVHAWGLDQVSAGGVELAPAENEGTALIFKPGGKKPNETVAVYNSVKDAENALQVIFAALNNRHRGSGLGGVLKIAGLVVAVLLVLLLLGSLLGGSNIEPSATVDENAVGGQDDTLPVGEPFPVDEFVRKTSGAPAQDSGL